MLAAAEYHIQDVALSVMLHRHLARIAGDPAGRFRGNATAVLEKDSYQCRGALPWMTDEAPVRLYEELVSEVRPALILSHHNERFAKTSGFK